MPTKGRRPKGPGSDTQNFFQVGNDVFDCPDLNSSDLVVIMTLSRHAKNKSTESWPSVHHIANDGHLHHSTVELSLTKLESLNIISITRSPGRLNHYFINDHRRPPRAQETPF